MSQIGVEGVISIPKDEKYPVFQTGVFNTERGPQNWAKFRIGVYQGKNKDGKATYGNYDCMMYGTLADNAVAQLKGGDHVVVVGRLKVKDYQTQEGEWRKSAEISVDALGAAISRFEPKEAFDDRYNPATGTVGRVQYAEKAGKSRAAQNGVVHADNAPVSLRKEAPIPDEEFPLDFSGLNGETPPLDEIPVPF